MKSSYGTMIITYYQMQLLLLLAYAGMTHSQVHYITPSSKVPCPGDPCLTLAQFAANSTNYLGMDVTNIISLSFLPGNHSLDRELSLSHADNFSMTKDIDSNGTVFIECSASKSQSGRFNISEIMFVVIKNLHFIGCGSNRIIQVKEFVAEDTIFQGMEGSLRGTALVLKNVTTGHISRCFFTCNALVNNYNDADQNTVPFFINSLSLVAGGSALQIELNTSLSIISCEFTNNSVAAADIANTCTSLNFDVYYAGGGALYITAFSNVSVINSTFKHNRAGIGGALLASRSHLYLVGNTYSYNSAHFGGVMAIMGSSVNIDDNYFGNNKAKIHGGVMMADKNQLNIKRTTFANNTANCIGGAIVVHGLSSNITNSIFINNRAIIEGGVLVFASCSIYISNSIFRHNSGSLYTFNSNLTLSGHSTFENCTESSNRTLSSNILPSQEGGAITSIHSNVIFMGEIKLLKNRARHGGAMLVSESKIKIYNETVMANNSATRSGGGIFLQQSDIEIRVHNCIISNNDALMGGGIHASSSTISVYQPGSLQFIKNKADHGGGVYLRVNPKVYMYILNSESGQQTAENIDSSAVLLFQANLAKLGGAVHIDDNANSGACSSDDNNECFVQTFPLYSSDFDGGIIVQNTASILFSDNTASSEQGANLFGGLLDRCIPTPLPFNVGLLQSQTHHNGISYLVNISNKTALDTISSLPVRICFCNGNVELDCSYQPPTFKAKKGEAFTVSLVAVDQVNHSVNANISSYLTSHDGGFGEGQQTQSVGTYCSNVTFNVFSPHNFTTINLYADGPCGNSKPSIRYLDINFTDCTCPVGFQPSNMETKCECICNSQLRPHITSCNLTTESLVRVNTTAWITYINDTDAPGYIIHPHCPFDYCQPPTKTISLNLNYPSGKDKQCAHNRRGILCGACQEHLSLSLGSSRCLPCPSYWPAIFVVILLAFIVAGILLVMAILVLNITVAVGLINSFIFYANIVAANSAVFFPSTEVSFPTVVIAWLNLEIGIDVCFFDGFDTYGKTWVQLAFPAYIISLVIIIILVSEYSPRFAGLIGKKDPIATLATLILLSYAKLLSVSIIILFPASLDYPDGSQMTVWLLDGTVKYREHKLLALFIVSLLIILIIVIPYTTILLLWQWVVRAPEWKIFKWTRNTKHNSFVSVYHVPYNSKYRCWTGLQLLVRVVLYITATRTTSDDPEAILLATIVLVGGLLALKVAGVTVYKSLLVDAVDTIINLNILVLSACSFYHFKTDPTKQSIALHASTIITLILLVGAFAYHIFLLVRKDKCPKEEKEEDGGILLVPVQPANTADSEITHSVIEIPQPRNESPPPQANTDEAEISNTY